MKKPDLRSKSFVFVSHAGCFLPFLMMLNLFFGWMFFKLTAWLFIELGLVLLFVLNSVIFTKKLFSAVPRSSGVIDIEARVVEDKERLK